MSIIKDMWNSKAFEIVSEVNYEVLKGIGAVMKGIASCALEVTEGMCNQSATITSNKTDVEKETYEYWRNLSCVEQQDYFKLNYKLQEYGENYRYDNRDVMAKSIAEIARKENRSFCNKYDQY